MVTPSLVLIILLLTALFILSTYGQEFVILNLTLPEYNLQDFCSGIYNNQLVIYESTTAYTLYINNNESLYDHISPQWKQHDVPAIPEGSEGERNGISHPCTQYTKNGLNITNPVYGDSIYGISAKGYYLMIYNISTQQLVNYTTYNSLLPAQQLAACMIIEENIIYIIGGIDGENHVVPTVYSYNIHTDTWSTLNGTLNLARSDSGCAAWNQGSAVLFVFGGATTFSASSTIEMMFVSYPDEWILQQATMSIASEGHECIYHPVSMYIYCVGDDENTHTGRVDVFSFDLDNNINAPSMSIKLQKVMYMHIGRSSPSVMIYQDHLYVLGGSNTEFIEMLSLTSSPTNAPSSSPSNAPTLPPSSSPTSIPTPAPTTDTATPTMSPTASPQEEYIYVTSLVSNSMKYDPTVTYKTFLYVVSILIGLVAAIGFIGFLQAKSAGIVVDLVSLFKFLLYLLDSVSDTFFCINLFYMYLDDHSEIDLILLIASIIFIIVPCLLSLYEMERFISRSIKQDSNDKVMIQYFKQHSYKLYVICLLIGNFHATILLFTSNLFDLQTFKLSINENKLLSLQNKYFIHSTIFENVPQLIISIVYSIYHQMFLEDIVLFTVISGILSIIVSLFTFITRRKLIRHTFADIEQSTIVMENVGYVSLKNEQE